MNQTEKFLPFFEGNNYFIDERVNLFEFENSYKVFNDKGEQIGNIKQKISTWFKILSLLISKAMFPFTLEITDNNNVTQTIISRGWTFWMSKISISNSEGIVIGSIHQKFKLFKPTLKIMDAYQKEIATIQGDWKAWNFTINDSNNTTIGTISKKWAGALKEIFTSADKYNVAVVESVKEDIGKMIILSAAICIDMIFKESK
jgi:uncharacterized protein YxjI